jgi:hypothetical protein
MPTEEEFSNEKGIVDFDKRLAAEYYLSIAIKAPIISGDFHISTILK